MIITIFILLFALLFRLLTLVVSQNNEKQLIELNSIQYGTKNSKIMSIFWVLLYIGVIIELIIKNFFSNFENETKILENFSGYVIVNNMTVYGFLLLLIAFALLFKIIQTMGVLYIVKLYKTPGQILITNPLFKYIKHPIYFLVLIPELIALGLISQSWFTWIIFGSVCLVTVFIRIKQENLVIAEIIKENQN